MKKVYSLLILVIGFTSSLQAQEPIFDFFTEGGEYSNYESLFFDPNYDQNHQISSYSIDDFLDISHQYNDRNQIVQKRIALFDEKYFDSEVHAITDYRYDDKGYLIEKIASFSNPILDEIYYVTTISYNSSYTIDTARLICNKKLVSYNNEYTDYDLKTIRYWNDNRMQIDSIYLILDYTKDESSTESSMSKSIFAYDDQNRCAKVQTFRKSETISNPNATWEEWYTCQFVYKPNQTVCTQTFTTQGFDIISLDVDSLDSSKQPSQLIYTVKRDENNRITSKQIELGDSLLYISQYQYNDKGKTAVQSEMKGIPGISFLSNRTLYQIITPMYSYLIKDNYPITTIKYDIEHNDSVQISKFKINDSNGNTVNKRKTYDPVTNKLLQVEYEDRGLMTEKVVKAEFTYLPNDTLLITASRNRDGVFTPLAKGYYKYDEFGRKIYTEKYEYSESDSTYIPDQKKINEYDDEGNICFYEYYSLDQDRYYSDDYSPQQWYGEHYERVKIDSKNNRIERTLKLWRDGQWVDDIVFVAQYDDRNRPVLEEFYLAEVDSSLYIPSQGIQLIASYDDTNHTITDIASFRDADQNEWQYDSKRVTQYDGYIVYVPTKKNLLKTNREFDIYGLSDIIEGRINGYKKPNSGYQQTTKTIYNWDVENSDWVADTQEVKGIGDGKESNTLYTWNKEAHQWIGESRNEKISDDKTETNIAYSWDDNKKEWCLNSKYIYNNDGNSQTEKYECDSVTGSSVGLENEIRTYDPIESTQKRVYRTWDESSQKWENFAMITSYNDDTHIYDVYNKSTNEWEHSMHFKTSYTSSGASISELSYWQNEDWIKSLRSEMLYDETEKFEVIPVANRICIYNAKEQSWMPLYQIPYKGFSPETEYQIWNAEANKMENYILYNESESLYSLWDFDKNEYVPVEYNTIKSQIETVQTLFRWTQVPNSYEDAIYLQTLK